jgi:rhodanese-related sulfurtransferase
MRHIEDDHQIALFQWVRLKEKTDPRYSSIIAIPNGGKRSKATAARMKAAGVKAGVSDIFVAVAMGGYHGMWLEMKKPLVKGEAKPKTSPEQKAWIVSQLENDYMCGVCYGWEEARDAIISYMGVEPT